MTIIKDVLLIYTKNILCCLILSFGLNSLTGSCSIDLSGELLFGNQEQVSCGYKINRYLCIVELFN